VLEATQAAGARVAQIKGSFQNRFAARILKTVCYDMFTTDEVRFLAGPEAAAAMRQRLQEKGEEVPETAEAIFEGGSFVQGSGATFDDLALEIEAFSMERPSDQTKALRASFYTNVLPQLAAVLPQLIAQGWKPKPLLRAVGEGFAIPNLEDQVDIAQLLQAAKSPVPGEDPIPRLLRDIGAVHMQAGQLARPRGSSGRPMNQPKQLAPKVPALQKPAMAKAEAPKTEMAASA